jgi:methionyl-tRNA synthetase
MSSKDTFFLSTPIYYVNDAPHIGHAYTTTAGDVLTRWHRQRGEKVWFLTGTDEHGTKVQRTAEANNFEPQDWADKLVSEAWLPVLKTIEAIPDDFIRTTSEKHKKGVQYFWEQVKQNGYVYEGSYEGPYCVGCEEFKLPGDLIKENNQELCPIHSKPVEMLQEKNWFFKLKEFQQPLIDHYTKNPQAIQPVSAYNEVMAFLKKGLEDISMSRSAVSWGIELPWDKKQVVYVWFDALLNYITATGYGSEENSAEAKLFKQVWPIDVHLVGKDILRFHAVYWPAMLMAAKIELPKCVFAHGWLLVGGEKMSKTKLTGIAPSQIVDYVGADAFRYYFLSAISFGQDGSFSWEDLTARYTSELANGLGNLASREAAMIEKYFAGKISQPGPLNDQDKIIVDLIKQVVPAADAAIMKLDFSTGIDQIRKIVDAANLYVTEQEPWKVAKDPANNERLATILYCVAEALRSIAILYHSIMPESTKKIWKVLGLDKSVGELTNQKISQALNWGEVPVGSVVIKGEPIFPRLLEDEQ